MWWKAYIEGGDRIETGGEGTNPLCYFSLLNLNFVLVASDVFCWEEKSCHEAFWSFIFILFFFNFSKPINIIVHVTESFCLLPHLQPNYTALLPQSWANSPEPTGVLLLKGLGEQWWPWFCKVVCSINFMPCQHKLKFFHSLLDQALPWILPRLFFFLKK